MEYVYQMKLPWDMNKELNWQQDRRVNEQILSLQNHGSCNSRRPYTYNHQYATPLDFTIGEYNFVVSGSALPSLIPVGLVFFCYYLIRVRRCPPAQVLTLLLELQFWEL